MGETLKPKPIRIKLFAPSFLKMINLAPIMIPQDSVESIIPFRESCESNNSLPPYIGFKAPLNCLPPSVMIDIDLDDEVEIQKEKQSEKDSCWTVLKRRLCEKKPL